jgi:hypothetical protein
MARRVVVAEEAVVVVVVIRDVNADVDDDDARRRRRRRIVVVFSRLMMVFASARSQRVLLCTYYIMFDRVFVRGEARRGPVDDAFRGIMERRDGEDQSNNHAIFVRDE